MYVSATHLSAAILATDVANVGTPAVTITNPTSGGGTSNAVTFTVTEANYPTPAITTLLPTGTTAGSGAFTLTVNGSGFINGSAVNFNGSARLSVRFRSYPPFDSAQFGGNFRPDQSIRT
jgi:hypothetical protein